MRKYLREIEMAGVILAIIGIVSSLVWGAIYGGWLCGIGIALFLLVLERKARRFGQCEFISICNAEGQPYAAAFLVWDQHYLYYLIPAYDPAFNDSGASALLALEAMKLAREKHVHFDFEGSMEKGIAEHYRQFGSSPTKYYSVEKYYKPIFRLAIWWQKVREMGMW